MFQYTAQGMVILGPTLEAIAATIIGTLIGWAAYQQNMSDQKDSDSSESEKERYAPDRPLPKKPNGEPAPESDLPHTQLGMRKGRKAKYPVAREFDENGKHQKDIDFTDHGRLEEHTNPHQHKYEENGTGGSLKRGDPEPLPDWRYL